MKANKIELIVYRCKTCKIKFAVDKEHKKQDQIVCPNAWCCNEKFEKIGEAVIK